MQEARSPSSKEYLPGLAAAFAIALVSVVLAAGHTALDPLILAILISIITANLAGPSPRLDAGISLAQRTFIPAGIILYGAQMDLRPLVTIGAGAVLYLAGMVLIVLLSVVWFSRKLGIGTVMGLLLAAGSAICGASAIVVLAPVLGAKKEDISLSLLSITVVGLAGVILYPLLQEAFVLSERTYALLCGSTLYQVGQVKAAAALVSPAALAMAVPVKLVRVGMLLPVALSFSFLHGGSRRKLFIPWFIVAAVAAAVATNTVGPLTGIRPLVAPYATFLFSMAISAIGLSVDLETIVDAGPRPLFVVFCSWLVLIALFSFGMLVIG